MNISFNHLTVLLFITLVLTGTIIPVAGIYYATSLIILNFFIQKIKEPINELKKLSSKS